jgi:hypothetical protein
MIFLFAALLVALIMADSSNCSYRQKYPGAPSYRFGYGLGWFLVAQPFCNALGAMNGGATLGEPLIAFGVSALLFSLPIWFLFRRRKGALVDGLVCSSLWIGAFLNLAIPILALGILGLFVGYLFVRRKSIWCPSNDVALPQTEASILIHDGETQSGAFTLTEIRDRIKERQISRVSYFWYEGCDTWVPIERLPKAGKVKAAINTPCVANSLKPTALHPPETVRKQSTGIESQVSSERLLTPRLGRFRFLLVLATASLVAVLWGTHGKLWMITVPEHSITETLPTGPVRGFNPAPINAQTGRELHSLSKSGVRHRSGCKYFNAAQASNPNEGRACKVCRG